MGSRRRRYRRIVRRTLGGAALIGVTLAIALSPAALAQDPPHATAAPGQSATMNVADPGCPWPVVPEFVGYSVTPDLCSGAPYEFEFFVAPEAAPTDVVIPIYDCPGTTPPDCNDVGRFFTLSIAETESPPPASASPTETVTLPIGSLVPVLRQADLEPQTDEQDLLNGWLEHLERAIDDEGRREDALDGLPALREGESYVVRFELPSEMLRRAAKNSLGDREGEVQTTITAKLTGTGFDDRPISEEIQRIEPETDAEWEWELTPAGSGSARINLSLEVVATLGSTVWPEPVGPERRTLPIQANWPYKIASFFADSWQWLLGTVIPIAVGSFGIGRKTDPARRRERERESADRPTPPPPGEEDEDGEPAPAG